MTILTYKGYQGSVEYEDGDLVIRLLHINDLITDSCTSSSKVEAVFHELVDDYLQTCADVGVEPEKPFSGTFNIRIAPELHKAAVKAATAQGVSLNVWVGEAIGEKIHAIGRTPRAVAYTEASAGIGVLGTSASGSTPDIRTAVESFNQAVRALTEPHSLTTADVYVGMMPSGIQKQIFGQGHHGAVRVVEKQDFLASPRIGPSRLRRTIP